MMETRQHNAIDQLQTAVLQAGIDAVQASSEDEEKRTGNEKKQAVSPRSGAPTPPGRPKGVRNKLTNLRDAVLEAFDTVGGAEYLVRLAEGTQSDRAAFTSLVAKVLPTQINQNVEGGIKLELSWLGGRNIGTNALPEAEKRSQVIDLERDASGEYRIADPIDTPAGGRAGEEAGSQAGQSAQKGAEGPQDA